MGSPARGAPGTFPRAPSWRQRRPGRPSRGVSFISESPRGRLSPSGTSSAPWQPWAEEGQSLASGTRQGVSLPLALGLSRALASFGGTVLPSGRQGPPLSAALPKHGSRRRVVWVWAAGVPTGRTEAGFLPGARHWPPATEGSGGYVCFRSKLQTSGCTCPQKPPLLRSREELDAFLELQHQGGRPSRVVWTRVPLEASSSLPLCCPTLCLFCLPAAGSVPPGVALTLSDRGCVCGLYALSLPLCLCALSPTLSVLPLSLRLSVPPFLCLSSALMWASLFLSSKGPCSPNCDNCFFLWTSHFSVWEPNL